MIDVRLRGQSVWHVSGDITTRVATGVACDGLLWRFSEAVSVSCSPFLHHESAD